MNRADLGRGEGAMADQDVRIVRALPATDWLVVGRRIANSIERAGLTIESASVHAGLDADDVQRQVNGEPRLSAFELQQLAELLATTTGAWFYDDRPALFRGQAASDAAADAERIGRELMLRHLGLEAACG